ncbi:unnamed protein product, partial [Ectocarpus fasciculatus]
QQQQQHHHHHHPYGRQGTPAFAPGKREPAGHCRSTAALSGVMAKAARHRAKFEPAREPSSLPPPAPSDDDDDDSWMLRRRGLVFVPPAAAADTAAAADDLGGRRDGVLAVRVEAAPPVAPDPPPPEEYRPVDGLGTLETRPRAASDSVDEDDDGPSPVSP